MSSVAGAMFACLGCGNNYKWKEELAGRRVKCKCGQVMSCPSAPPSAAEQNDDDGLYGFAEDDLAALAKGSVVAEEAGLRCPACQQPMEAGTVMCTHCAFNLKTRKKMNVGTGGAPVLAMAIPGGASAVSPMLGYAGAVRRSPEGIDSVGHNMWIEYWIPAALIVVGIFLNYLQLTSFDRIIYNSTDAMKVLGFRLLIDETLLIIGSLLAIQLLDVSLGSPGPALLKITAIAIGPGALANMLGYLAHDPTHMLAFAVNILLAMTMFYYFFDFDLRDGRILAVMVAIIRTWLGYGILFLMLHGGLTHMPRLGTAEINSDRLASDAIDYGWATDAKTWLDRGGRLLGHSILPWSYDLVNSLHDAGCSVVDARFNGGYAYVLYAELPSNSVKRAACFQAAALFYQRVNVPLHPMDKGQRYLVMPLM